MIWILDIFKKVKPWLPGQAIHGAMAYHDHFPDREKHGVRVQKIRKIATTLQNYDAAIKAENKKEYSPQYNAQKAAYWGFGVFAVLALLSLPIGTNLVGYGAFKLDQLGGPMLMFNFIAMGYIALFIWTNYRKRMDQIDRDKAYWKFETVGNHLLVHVLTSRFKLVPRYSKKKLIVLDEPVLLNDGKTTKRIEMAPGFIPRSFTNSLPRKFKVKAENGSGLLDPSNITAWPSVNVPITYWKFEYERPFRLTLGEIYMEDGRWSHLPTLVKNDPAGLYTGTIIFGGTGTGKSQSALLNYMFQILSWNAGIESEAQVIDYLNTIGKNLRAGGEEGEWGFIPLDEILKLSEEAYDKMQEEGKGYAFEKMFMVVFEPKGELHVDIRHQAKLLGRANDMVELGTDQVQIDKWRETRHALHSASLGVFSLWDGSALESDLRNGLVANMRPFWMSEIIRRFKSKDWASLGSGFGAANAENFIPTPFTLKDFNPDAKPQVPPQSAVTLPGNKTAQGETALSDILKSLEDATGRIATQLYSVGSFGVNDYDPNLFTGFVFRKERVLKSMGSGFQEGGVNDAIRDALVDCLALLGSSVGVLQTGSARPGEGAGSGVAESSCDGLFRGLSAAKREGGFFPSFRGISLLPLPTVPEGDENALPDIPQMIAADLNGKSPVDDDEERVLKMVRMAAPMIRRSGEDYGEWDYRKNVAKIVAEKRYREFQEAFRRLCHSCSRLMESGLDIREPYEDLHSNFFMDSSLSFDEAAGTMEFESSRVQQTQWQHLLMRLGFSPIAERANGRFDDDIRVGLLPTDAAWHTGCWEALSGMIQRLAVKIVSEAARRAMDVSSSDHSTGVGTNLRIHCHRFFEALDQYVGCVHRYYAVMVPGTMGFVLRQVNDRDGLGVAALGKLALMKGGDPVGYRRLSEAWARFEDRGFTSVELVDGAGGEWFTTRVVCNGTNQFNPLYQPDVAPESVAAELGSALTAGDKANGESFWSDGYTMMSGQYIGLNMAANGWVTFNDVLNCFMHGSFRARLLMQAEARLEEMKALFRRLQDPSVVTGATVQVWGDQALPDAQVAEREWALKIARDMTGLELGAGEWMGSYMDGGKGRRGDVSPLYGPISASEILSIAPGAKLPSGGSFDLVKDLGLEAVLQALRDSKAALPGEGNLVLRKVVGAYLSELGERIAGGKQKDGKLRISKTLCDSFLSGNMVFGLSPNWEFRKWSESLARKEASLKISLVLPLTPPPILGAQIQSLQSIIESYKNFDAVALRGDALKDAKTKGNIMISYMVKVFGLRSEGAMYSFSPRSRYSITFPTFDEVRTRGLIVCSRITEGIYQDVGLLISRMCIQQFQRTIKSRAGRQKTLLYGTNEAPPRIDVAHKKSHNLIKEVVKRLVPLSEDGNQRAMTPIPMDPKGKLDHYVKKVHEHGDTAFGGLLSPSEEELLNTLSQRFLRQVRAQLGSQLSNELPDVICERLVAESLAFMGYVQSSRMKEAVAGDLLSSIEAAGPGTPRGYQDDQVLRGMALFANHSEVGYKVGKAFGRAFDKQVVEKLQRLFYQALGEYQGMLSFARMQGDTSRLREEGQRGVEFVIARRDLTAEVTVIQDEPDFRRLGAFINDEVQKFVIPSSQRADGDAGYLEVARAGMCFNIMATQMPTSLKKALGEDFKRYLGNLLTWVCLMLPDLDDAKLVVEMFGVSDGNTGMSVEGSLEGVTQSSEGLRGRTDNLNVKYNDKEEKKALLTAHELMSLEAMQGYVRWRDGQRTNRGKLYTTPAFILTGQIPNQVNPYGPKELMLRAEERYSRNPNMVLSYAEAMEIVNDHGLPWIEEPVVVLIQHRVMDMSKSVSTEEAERDARLHANRAYLQVKG